MQPSSNRSDAVFIPRRERSRAALLLWLLQHGVAAVALGVAGLPGYVKWVLGIAIAVSLRRSFPGRSPGVSVAADGTLRLFEHSGSEVELLEATSSWVSLRYQDAAGRRRMRRIWFDVFSEDDRRRLRIVLRERRRRAE